MCETGRSGDMTEGVCGLGEGAGSRHYSAGRNHHGVHRHEVVAEGSVKGRESGRWTWAHNRSGDEVAGGENVNGTTNESVREVR